MIPKKRDNGRTWFHLLLGVGTLLLLLAACARDPTSSTASGTASDPTSTTQTPLAVTNSTPTTTNTPAPTPAQTVPAAAPTSTPIQAAPVQGSLQTVMITNTNGSFGFDPGMLTIKVGTTITWKNVSSAPHTVTSDDGTTFDSGTVPVGNSFSFTFKTPGSFPYHCNIHPYMRSTIVVV